MGMVAKFFAITEQTAKEIQSDPEIVSEIMYDEDSEACRDDMDLDKAWQGIHFLLTGEPFGGNGPLASAIMGGDSVGEDAGYGPPRLMSADQVKEVNIALQAISPEELASRFNPDRFYAADLYPFSEPQAEDLDYIIQNYKWLRKFYSRASERDYAAILALT